MPSTNPSPSSPPLGVSKELQELFDAYEESHEGSTLESHLVARTTLLTAIAALETENEKLRKERQYMTKRSDAMDYLADMLSDDDVLFRRMENPETFRSFDNPESRAVVEVWQFESYRDGIEYEQPYDALLRTRDEQSNDRH